MRSYEHIVARPFFCVAALMEMILKAELINGLGQDDIAEYFGVNIPPDFEGAPISNVIRTPDSTKWGIVTGKDGINEFFKEFNLPFTEEYSSIRLFQDWMFEDELELALKKDVHVICGYEYGSLFPESETAASMGHASIILSISDPNGESRVSLYNPGPLSPGVKEVRCYDLFSAIHARNDGVWKIKREK